MRATPTSSLRWLRRLPTLAVICVAIGAVLATASCTQFRQVRKQIEGTQEPAPQSQTRPSSQSPQQTQTPQSRATPSLQLPSGEGSAGAPLPRGNLALPAQPGVHLTPPPGVVPVTRVAILLPLSGETSEVGQALLNAAQLALFSLAGDNFALMPIDTKGTPDGAAAAAKAAVEDGARLVLGPVFSSSVRTVAPILGAAGIQTVAFSNDRSVAGNGVYVLGITPEAQVRRVTAYAAGRGIKRIAALLPDGAFGDRVAAALDASARDDGVSVGQIARYAVADTKTLTPIVRRLANYDARHDALLQRHKELEDKKDEASQRALQRLRGLDTLGDVDFDAVLLPEGGSALRNLAPLLRFYDVDPRKVRVLGSAQWDDPVFATEPSLFGGWFPAPAPAARKPFEKLYAKTYGEKPQRIASLAYDATGMAAVIARARAQAEAEARAQTADTKRLAAVAANPFTVDALTAPNGFAGVDGIFRLRPSGLVERKLAVMEVRNRHFVVVSPAARTFRKLRTGKATDRAGAVKAPTD